MKRERDWNNCCGKNMRFREEGEVEGVRGCEEVLLYFSHLVLFFGLWTHLNHWFASIRALSGAVHEPLAMHPLDILFIRDPLASLLLSQSLHPGDSLVNGILGVFFCISTNCIASWPETEPCILVRTWPLTNQLAMVLLSRKYWR